MIVRAALVLNPVAQVVARAVVLEMERRADDRAARVTGRARRAGRGAWPRCRAAGAPGAPPGGTPAPSTSSSPTSRRAGAWRRSSGAGRACWRHGRRAPARVPGGAAGPGRRVGDRAPVLRGVSHARHGSGPSLDRARGGRPRRRPRRRPAGRRPSACGPWTRCRGCCRASTGASPGTQSIEGAERALGTRLFLPAFFPGHAAVAARRRSASTRGRRRPRRVAFAGRDGSPDRLVIYQAPGRRATVPMALMPAGPRAAGRRRFRWPRARRRSSGWSSPTARSPTT